ncbi:acyl-CoA desaturase [Nostoc flagelliforme FACHB-838]|uniref:Acyl-CoA desaturase n=1 Tax=Nostoc flagelliforme FACHB-838 TaxID=2692904 RepID=A0ABR8DYZ3_9NOSO|nr:acyl-CoA desaturase [Nostoc flagelliforme]MBD2534576.1 acyl-CoA desaturase [Nostoc flagelliforme FACHB-838]
MSIQPDCTIKLEPAIGSPRKNQITIENEQLQELQRRFALAIVLIPFLGSILAIGLLYVSGIGLVEIALLISMYALTTVGVSVGFHRHFAHRAFKTKQVIRITLAILGSMAAQGPIIFWVATHRRHHQYSDLPGDPHSPRLYEDGIRGHLLGLWHAHVGWLFDSDVTNSVLFAKDLLPDIAIARVNRLYLIWVILGLAIPAVLGGILTGTSIGAFQGFMWGGIVRIFLAHNATWSLNSITHVFGRRSFDSHDYSRNIGWLAILTVGEGWHNNHHAFPNSARFGLKWWQIDQGYWVIRALEVAGMVWDVKVPTAGMIEAKKAASRK